MLEERHTLRALEVIDSVTIRRFASGPELSHVPLTPFMFRELWHSDWDIIHAHEMLAPASFYSAVAARARRKPLIVTEHDYMLSNHGLKLLLYIANNLTVGRFTLRTASAAIGISSGACRFVQRFGATPSKTEIIPTSVDTNLFHPDGRNLLRERWSIEGPMVLFVGRLEKNKGIETLLRAFHSIVPDVPDAKLVIVGGGPEEYRLHDLQRKLNLNNVFFLGRLPRGEMPHIYPGCDLFVLPSLYEPFGNVVLEAMASGLPVIGSKIGGMADMIIHGLTGYHIKPGDLKQLASFMRQLLLDKELSAEMSVAARQRALQTFDDMVVARSVEKTYLECLDR